MNLGKLYVMNVGLQFMKIKLYQANIGGIQNSNTKAVKLST